MKCKIVAGAWLLLVLVVGLGVVGREKMSWRSHFVAQVKSDLPQLAWSPDGKFVRVTQRFLLGRGDQISEPVQWVFDAHSRKRVHLPNRRLEEKFPFPDGVFKRDWRTNAVSFRLMGSTRWVQLQGVTFDDANPIHMGKWILAGLGYSRDKSALLLAWNQEVGTWSTRTGQLLRRVKFHPRGLERANCRMNDVDFSRDGKSFVACWELYSSGERMGGHRMQGMFDQATGLQKFVLPPSATLFSPRDGVVCSLLSPLGQRGAQIEMRDMESGRILWKSVTEDTVQFVDSQPFVVLREKTGLEVRDENTGTVVRRIPLPQTRFGFWEVSPDGSQVWTWKDGKVLAWRQE